MEMVTLETMPLELRQDTISAEREQKNEQAVQAHILQLRTATEEEVRAVLDGGTLREGTSTKFLMEMFLQTRTIVRGDVQKLFETGGQTGDIINKTIRDIYYRPSHFKAPQLADFAVYSDLTNYGTKLSDKFTIITAKNVVMVKGDEGEAGIKAIHAKFQSKTAGLKDVKKHAVSQALAHQCLGLGVTTLAAGFELSEEEILEIINDLNVENLQTEGLRIAVRNGIAILTTLRSDGKIFVLDTPETRKAFLTKPVLSPLKKRIKNTTGAAKGTRRSRTIALKRLTRDEIEEGKKLIEVDTKNIRPQNRGECIEADRPCPYAGCKYNLYLDVDPNTGSIKLNFPDIPIWEMRESCVLDIADRGGITLEETGELFNLTLERIRQVEVLGLEKLRAGPQGQDLIEGGLLEESTEGLDLLGLSLPRIKRRKKAKQPA